MKKFLAFIFIVMYAVSCASVGFASSYNENAIDKLWAGEKSTDLIKSLKKLADQIVAHNKPTFDTTLTKSDRDTGEMYGLFPAMWDRVWAKDKTIVTAQAYHKKKDFYSTSLTTADSNMVFAGGIRVGASIAVLEKFFNAPLNQIAFRPGVVFCYSASDFETDSFHIFYDKSGKITEIHGKWGEWAPIADKTGKFIEKMRKQLGFPNSDFELLKFD